MKEHIIINKDRTVVVPDSVRKIGIQYDHKVNTLTFDCPRYADDNQSIDLSRMAIYINFSRNDKTKGSIAAANVFVDPDDPEIMHFDFVITRSVTLVNGPIICLVCAKSTDAEGVEVNHWNSELFNKLSVGEGMEAEEELTEEEIDYITGLLQQINTTHAEVADIDTRVEDLEFNQEKQGVVSEVDLVAMTWTEGSYITGSGTVGSSSGYGISELVTLPKMSTLILDATGYQSDVAMIAKSDHTPLVTSVDGKTHYEYYTDEEIQVYISCETTAAKSAKIVRNVGETLSDLERENSELKGDLNELGITNVTSPTDYALQFPNVNKALDENGKLYDLNGYNTSDFIEYGKDVVGIYRTGTEVKFYLFRYAYYDINKQLLEFKNDTTDYDIVDYDGKRVTWLTNAPEGTKYVRVCYDTARSMYEYYIVKNVIVGHDISNLTTDGHNILKLKGKTVVNFGDSIFGNKRPPNDISTEIANITGATVYNCAFGGCRMAKRSDLTTWDAFAMYNLSYSIANNDYSKQDSAISDTTWTDKPSYFDETLSLLKSIDFSKVDIITISYATNDWYAGASITDGNETRDMQNFCDAMRYSIETISSAYPHIKIFMCCPTWRYWENFHQYGYDYDYIDSDSFERLRGDGVKLTDFVEKIKNISKEYHLPCIDNYYEIPINKFNRSHWFPSNDGTHHNEKGGKLIAEHMSNVIF